MIDFWFVLGFVLQVLMYFDYVFTAIFALEVIIKVREKIRKLFSNFP